MAKKRRKKQKYIINEYGVKIPVSLIERGNKYKEQVNRIRQQKRNKYLPQKYNEALGEDTTVGAKKLMSQSQFQELNDVRFNPNVYNSIEKVKSKVKQLRRQTTQSYYNQKNRQYKENFLKSLDTVYKGVVDDKALEDLKKKVKRLRGDELTELKYQGELNDLDFRYINTEYHSSEDVEDYFNAEMQGILDLYNRKYKRK